MDKYRKAKKGFCTFIGVIGLISTFVGLAIDDLIFSFCGISVSSIALIIRTKYL